MTDAFFYDDSFYGDIGDMIDDMDNYLSDFSDMPDDWKIECFEASLEPIVTINEDWIFERINEERFPEEEGNTFEKLSKAIQLIPFDKVMEAMPKLYYPSNKKFIITKNDLLEYIN